MFGQGHSCLGEENRLFHRAAGISEEGRRRLCFRRDIQYYPVAFEGEVLDHTLPTSDGLVGQPNAQFDRWALPELTQHTVKMERPVQM